MNHFSYSLHRDDVPFVMKTSNHWVSLIREETRMNNEFQMVYASLLVCKVTGRSMFANCPVDGGCTELAKNLRRLLWK
jgi:hypothetical protein